MAIKQWWTGRLQPTFDADIPQWKRDQISKIVDSIPGHIHQQLVKYGCKVRVVHHLDSSLGLGKDPDTRKWNEVGGVWYFKKKTILVATHLMSKSGDWIEKDVLANRRTVMHEAGHAVDYMGDYTRSPNVRQCYRDDVAQLKMEGKLGGDVTEYFVGTSVLAPYETFAHIFANLNGVFQPDLTDDFPRLTQFVRNLVT